MDRDTITKMLDSVRAEKSTLEKRIAVLDQRLKTLEGWLAEEQPMQLRINGGSPAAGSPLSVFLRGVLADGRPHQLAELTGLVEAKGGLVRENAKPGRVIHFALLGMSQHGHVERRKDGAWIKK
jgi:hypothetical protein